MKELQHLLSYVRRAVDDYQMISPGDVVAVGVSAGKDSLSLLSALAALRRFYPHPFSLIAITIDMGFPESDFSRVAAFCRSIDVPYYLVHTEIAHVIFDIRKESNPCSLCARMRRGALHEAAKTYGANKVALGHHRDDVVETLLLNLFFEGRIGTFSPVTYLSRTDLHLIRPMIYAPEKVIRKYAGQAELPVMKSPCPADGNTEREHMKTLLASLEREHRGVYHRMLGAVQRAGIDGYIIPGEREEE